MPALFHLPPNFIQGEFNQNKTAEQPKGRKVPKMRREWHGNIEKKICKIYNVEAMFRIAVCDDEKNIRELIVGYLERYAGENDLEFSIEAYESANIFLREYPRNLDIIFMDIKMNGIDGMNAAKMIRENDKQVCIIFITTMYQYAIEGYSVRAFGFIRKPLRYEELSHELSCALTMISGTRQKQQYVTLKNFGTVLRLPVFDISHCEVRNHTVYIYVSGDVKEFRGSMAELETTLSQYGFFRCHQSFLVNIDYIKEIESQQLLLTTGESIPISRKRKKEFLDEISRFIGERI